MKHKTILVTIGCLELFMIMISLTYAYWLVTRSQTNKNEIIATCLNINLTNEQNDILLTNILPMSDEEGMALTPYTFTVSNECNREIDYQINLESLNISGKTSSDYLPANSLKYSIDSKAPKILERSPKTSTTLEKAYESHKLAVGTLSPNGSESHSLRLWLAESSTISDQGKVFSSKISISIGHGIENPYKEGTLAYDILSNYGGSTTITPLSSKWVEEAPQPETYNAVGETDNNWYGTSYEFNPETGKFKLAGNLVQATLEECRNGTKACGNYTLKNSSETYESSSIYKITSFTYNTSALYMTTQLITAKNNFSAPATISETGLYKADDSLGESYYFRGAPTNNYVKFGTYAEDTTLTVYDYNIWQEKTINIPAGTPMYWRILRINGDGTIRLIYDGTELVANGAAHTSIIAHTAYNTQYANTKYIGYSYDTSDTNKIQMDSTIKGILDTWYDKYLEANYGKYIADEIFCNDREISEITASQVEYAPYGRLINNKIPKLICTQNSDKYTVSNTLGNGLLSNPVGLLTADEAFLAGGSTRYSYIYYLYSGEGFWTSAPYYLSGKVAHMWFVRGDGYVSYSSVSNDSLGVRPVLNLKADVAFTGNGTIDAPYEIR